MLIYPHTFFILLHLFALALGLGSALLADWIVCTRLAFGTITHRAAQQLFDLSHGVSVGLVLLWITGAVLVGDNAMAALASLDNQKLWAKMIVVAILTVNAVLLHKIVLPMVLTRVGQQLFNAKFGRSTFLCTLCGAVSATSWMFAVYLGVARELNGTVSLTQVLCYYGTLLLLIWAVSLTLTPIPFS